MALPGKTTKQTLLDLYSRPLSTRLATKGTGAKGPGAVPTDPSSGPKLEMDAEAGDMAPVKVKDKPKVVGGSDTPRVPESIHSEDTESNMSWSI